MTNFIVPSIIILLVFQAIFAACMNQVATDKGYDSEAHAFAMCFFFGIMGGLYVNALPDKNLRAQNDEIIALLRCKLENTNHKDVYNENDGFDDLPSL
jgi:hypothetical protein